ncbi:MAG: sterol desaturase family protein [Polyangiaceae bacterium]
MADGGHPHLLVGETDDRELAKAAARDRFRAEALAAIPPRYSPWAHFAVPSVFGVVVTVVALALLRDVRLLELALVPVFFVAFNGIEWVAHRDFLHVRRRGAEVLYDRHTPVHHRIFVEDDMALRDVREFGMVLIPAYGIVLIASVVAPLSFGLAWAGQRNVACLFAATAMAYAVSYEWLHLAYHAPSSSFVGRLGFVARLRRHHARHHRPSLMQTTNFNVSLPLFDWLLGTSHRDDGPRT